MIETTLTVLLGLALAFVGAELWLRRFYRRRGAAWPLEPNSRVVAEIDREALPSLDPIARFFVNADGERGDPLPSDWTRVYRVLVAGGSAAECFYLDQDRQWPSVVQRVLTENAAKLGVDRAHVGNIARSMQRCDYVAWMLQRMVPRLPRLDAVVLMVGASDLVTWLQDGCPAVVTPSSNDPDYCFQQHDFGPFAWTPSKLALREWLRRTRNRLFPKEHRRLRAGKTFAKHRVMRAAGKLIHETASTAPMLAYYEEWLRRTIDAARSSGARVLVVRQPWLQKHFTPEEAAQLWNFGRGRPYEEHVEYYYEIGLVHRLLAEVADVSERVALDMGVEVCELRTRLEPSFEIFYDTLHNTPKGCEAVGKLVAEALLSPPPAARSNPDRLLDVPSPTRAASRRAPGAGVTGIG
jgi:hypothetical protein